MGAACSGEHRSQFTIILRLDYDPVIGDSTDTISHLDVFRGAIVKRPFLRGDIVTHLESRRCSGPISR